MLKALFIDLDGTLADSLSLLYQVYSDFLAQYNIQGTKEEFESLNGLTHEEVMQALVTRHDLPEHPDQLVRRNKEGLYCQYQERLELFPDAKNCLIEAKERGLQLVIVSSAKMELVRFFLQQHELQHLIDGVVTAEGLKRGKPSPEIYQKALKQMDLEPEEVLAIEDANHGIEAATGANIPTIRFNPDKANPCPFPVLFEAENWEDIRKFLQNLHQSYPMTDIIVRPSTQVFPRVDELWNELKEDNPHLFNGKILNFVSIDEHGLVGEFVEYKYYMASLRDPTFAIRPVSISGIIQRGDAILIGKRASFVTVYGGLYETPPSGGIDPISEKRGRIDVIKQVEEEIFEETNLIKEEIQAITPFAIVEDPKGKTWEVCAFITVETEKELTSPDGEYEELFWVKKKDLSKFISENGSLIVPFTRFLLEVFIK